jgi:hypothetical protein
MPQPYEVLGVPTDASPEALYEHGAAAHAESCWRLRKRNVTETFTFTFT